MGLQTMLLIVLAGTFATAGSAQAITTAKSAFSPKSGDELKNAVNDCFKDANTTKTNESDTENSQNVFTFVLIPVSEDDPLREVELSKIFGPENDEVRYWAMEHFGYSEENEGEGNAEDVIETRPLDYARPENFQTIVVMYSDRKAQVEVKRPKVNKRATDVASACLTVPHFIHGDVIVARHSNNDGGTDWEYLDFFKNEMDKNAEWVLKAAASNSILGDKLVEEDEKNANSNMRKKDGLVSWDQTNDDVEISIDLPKGVKGRDISVIMKYNLIKIGLKNGHTFPEESAKDKTLLQRLLAGLEPPEIIDPELSTWTLTDGQLMIALTKRKSEVWHSLYKIRKKTSEL